MKKLIITLALLTPVAVQADSMDYNLWWRKADTNK